MARKEVFKSIGILNFEGDVLKAHATPRGILITDQWRTPVDFLGLDEFYEVLHRGRTITDSSGRAWVCSAEHKNAKPREEKLYEFIDHYKSIRA
jgi:hypothetical protein